MCERLLSELLGYPNNFRFKLLYMTFHYFQLFPIIHVNLFDWLIIEGT